MVRLVSSVSVYQVSNPKPLVHIDSGVPSQLSGGRISLITNKRAESAGGG